MRDHDDWEILHHLQRLGTVAGFISNDANMLDLPRKMIVLQRTRLTLVITAGVGHNAIRATGLLMVHLDDIVRRGASGSQLYVLKPSNLVKTDLHRQINKLAEREGVSPPELIRRERQAVEAHLGDVS